jgi:hypothetical protein
MPQCQQQGEVILEDPSRDVTWLQKGSSLAHRLWMERWKKSLELGQHLGIIP